MTHRRRLSRSFAAVLASLCLAGGWFFGAGAAPAHAQVQQVADTLYGALILATNAEQPRPPAEALRGQAANLHTVFGYNDFRVLAENRKTIATGQEDWLVPSRQFFLRVDTRRPVPGGYALGVQLLQQDRVMVDADVKLSRDRPLFIRGPLVANGQMIILLMVL